ncbi:MAG: hypothetical protein ACRCT7_17375 [Shewanella sp.]|uniref:hypothetical protein n=1 Tax=Shewanella sp. SNU WT4 TaxID=2590015 RepID=UPI00112C5A44|nr:hypothetical protein [Shewanella sp. SNU WT4]QDF67009.1 hypothetical protein FJQ87_10075 [Shewanella sp. SNU WT4]
MSANVLPQDQNQGPLSVLCRVEPGCLGPNGIDHIEEFCLLANRAIPQMSSNIALWQFTPRYDKSLPELQYLLNNKVLTSAQAERYLELHHYELDDFEEKLHERLSKLINQYLARQ